MDKAILNEECAKPVMDYKMTDMRSGILDSFGRAYLVGVVHAHSNTLALKVVHIECGRRATISWSIDELQLSSSRNDEIG